MKKKVCFTKQHAYLLLSILALLIFCNASIADMRSFGYAFAFALVANNFYGIIIIVCHFAFSLLFNFTFVGLVNSALVSALLIIFCILIKTIKKQSTLAMLLFCAFSRVSNIYFNFTSINGLLFALIDLVVGIGFCYCVYKVINVLLHRGVQSFTSTEKIGACICLTALFCGVSNIICVINVSKFIFILLILLGSIVLGNKTVYLACFIAIAHILTSLNFFNAMVYFIVSCVASWISPRNKFLSACVVCLCDALMGLFIDYGLIDLLPVVVAALVFIAIPAKLIKKVANFVEGSKTNLIGKYYIVKQQEILKSKLADMSSLFKQMQKCYRDLMIGNSSQEKVCRLLAGELKVSVCENCINKLACESVNLSPCFEELILRAQNRGKVNLLDVPPLLSSNCSKINLCLSHINTMAQEYVKKAKVAKSEDDNKLNISLQLGGTSKIFAELGMQFANTDKVNQKKSLSIKDCLQTKGVVCKECMATENNNGVHEVLLIVRNADVVNPEILKACEKFYNTTFEQKLCFQTKGAGWSLICAVPSNRYELLCGYATKPKDIDGANGDNYVYNKLTDSKYLVAICDGMGHGAQANSLSTLTINLIESYYKSGLSNQIVLDSVNSILLPASDNGFCTLDACIVDTVSGEVDFIKIGSSISVVKQLNKSMIINVESLPLGVVEHIVPTTHKVTLFAGDVVVLASDGIIDVFASHEEFCNYINNENIINMQLFAESILEEAIARKGSHSDDMTVIAYRLVQKR